MIMYVGTAVTEEVNIREYTMILLIVSLPGNLNLASGNAAMLASTMCPTQPSVTMNSVLNRYLKNGTSDSAKIENSSEKFVVVGCMTNRRGG